MENTAWSKMASKLEISLLRKAAVYFLEVFIEGKAIRTKVRSVYIIALDDIREKTFIKTSLVQRTTFGSSYTRLDRFLVVWDDRTTTGNVGAL